MLIAQRPTLTEEKISDTRSRFVLEPLEPGFGYTLGNSLRRTLLSSVPGAAITSIRINGVLHEFTAIEGMVEDVVELNLNIKSIVVSSDFDEPTRMYLRKSGPGAVTAGDIECPAGLTIHNPGLHLATLSDNGALDIEFIVERGRGYVAASQNKLVGAEIGRIPLDSIYSPVLKVAYKVEATRVEQRTDFDKLVIDVETKPCMTPRDAFASSGRTMSELLSLITDLNPLAEGVELGPSESDNYLLEQLQMPIEALELTVRSYNCLKRESIDTVGALISLTEADLADIRNFGSKSVDEVKEKLASMGLSLKDSTGGFDAGAVATAVARDFTFAPVAVAAAGADGDSAAAEDDDTAYIEDEQL
ncbi:MAG: DNA-directed RNA polymerase subunit alpha [Actinomycetales bacterium]|nr:DNA-directed RNA polymerase subunit alpha [Actinomycetales bacterium]